jgi:hypothetical protein
MKFTAFIYDQAPLEARQWLLLWETSQDGKKSRTYVCPRCGEYFFDMNRPDGSSFPDPDPHSLETCDRSLLSRVMTT